MTIYTGDILIKQLSDGSYDLEFSNGQPSMTNGLETMSLLAVFGEDWWGNDIFPKQSEKIQSGFPEVIRRAVVNDATKNNGTKAIEKSLAFLVKEKIASKVTVEAEITNAFTIEWLIEIEALSDQSLKFYINWSKGELTARFI